MQGDLSGRAAERRPTAEQREKHRQAAQTAEVPRVHGRLPTALKAITLVWRDARNTSSAPTLHHPHPSPVQLLSLNPTCYMGQSADSDVPATIILIRLSYTTRTVSTLLWHTFVLFKARVLIYRHNLGNCAKLSSGFFKFRVS